LFKIDKSSVEYIDSNKSIVVIKQWKQDEKALSPDEADENQLELTHSAAFRSENPEQMLKEARMQAEMMVQKAVNQVSDIKQEAWQQGYTKGVQEAKAEYAALWQEKMSMLQGILEEIQAAQEETVRELENSVLQLSLEIAEKIVNIQLERDDILFVGLIKKAILRLNPKEKFTVRVNQREFDKYFQNGGEWLSEELQSVPFVAVKDATIAPGGCVLESEDGVIKAGVDAQLKTIAMSLTERRYDEAL